MLLVTKLNTNLVALHMTYKSLSMDSFYFSRLPGGIFHVNTTRQVLPSGLSNTIPELLDKGREKDKHKLYKSWYNRIVGL